MTRQTFVLIAKMPGNFHDCGESNLEICKSARRSLTYRKSDTTPERTFRPARMELAKIHGVVIYSINGTRVIAQYYTSAIPPDKTATFEGEILQRGIEDQTGEVMQHDEFIVIYKTVKDLLLFLVCDMKSNELLMGEILDALVTSISLVYKNKVSAESLVQQIDLLYLLLDETIENGFVFEGDPEVVAARTMLKEDTAYAGKSLKFSSA